MALFITGGWESKRGREIREAERTERIKRGQEAAGAGEGALRLVPPGLALIPMGKQRADLI